ncbi:MAG: hypothetical protein NTV21_07250 [Planctomycetota bacterium]|nr:hypothetical protein [Planctomycetota bacterium]
MERTLSFNEIRRALAGFDEPRSVAAFERRARAEMAVLCGIAGIALLSVLLSLRSMRDLPEGSEIAFAAAPAVELTLVGERREAPQEAFANLASAPVSAEREVASESEVEALEPAPLARPAKVQAADARGEASWFAEYSAVASAEELALALNAAFGSAGTDAQRLAALRVSYERELPGTSALFERAAGFGEPVGHAAVAWLERRASREARARELLESLTLSSTLRDETRAASARALIASVDDGEAARIVARLGRDRSDLVYENARAALADRTRERAHEELR